MACDKTLATNGLYPTMWRNSIYRCGFALRPCKKTNNAYIYKVCMSCCLLFLSI